MLLVEISLRITALARNVGACWCFSKTDHPVRRHADGLDRNIFHITHVSNADVSIGHSRCRLDRLRRTTQQAQNSQCGEAASSNIHFLLPQVTPRPQGRLPGYTVERALDRRVKRTSN